jgi:hypothetical protein
MLQTEVFFVMYMLEDIVILCTILTLGVALYNAAEIYVEWQTNRHKHHVENRRL